jgi:hypothetical protein
MRLVPEGNSEKITFYQTHVARWAQDPAGIGVTPEAVADLEAKSSEARDAFTARDSAQAAARSATLRLDMALDAMATAGATLIQAIRAKASQDGNHIYQLALIPAPAKASPIGAPGTPTRFSFTLSQIGTLKLKWKCDNPRGAAGTMYQVWRRVGFEGEFTYLGGSGTKSFIDDTLPAGAASVTYQIQAVRSTATGPVATFNVNFGVSGARRAIQRVRTAA